MESLLSHTRGEHKQASTALAQVQAQLLQVKSEVQSAEERLDQIQAQSSTEKEAVVQQEKTVLQKVHCPLLFHHFTN